MVLLTGYLLSSHKLLLQLTECLLSKKFYWPICLGILLFVANFSALLTAYN